VTEKWDAALGEAVRVSSGTVVQAARRSTVQARLSDGRIFEALAGTTVAEILRVANGSAYPPAVAAVVNGRLRELTLALATDSDVQPITLSSQIGMRFYRRSLAFLLVVASAEIFPDAELFIEHSAPRIGAYFCSVRGRAAFGPQDLARIESRMREIVEEDSPLTAAEVPVEEAAALFRSRGEVDKALLLAHRQKQLLRLYSLRGRRDYFQGYMVASAGVLRHFALHASPPGFLLQFPPQSEPPSLRGLTPYPKIFAVFAEAGEWRSRLGIRDAGALNHAIVAGKLPEISLVAEALHSARVARIAAEIAAAHDRVRLVLIAGPSSSGKTTFSKRLAVQLLAEGVRPCPICLDDYFVERHLTPRDAEGQYDYESLRALDVPLFNAHLLALMEGEPVVLPRYVFKTGRREEGLKVQLGPDHVVIVEGIHGLNPELVPSVPADRIYRVYVSALTQLNLDRHNRVSTTDCRLIRRIVRDAATRGYDATDTLRRWAAVTRGEKRHIFPFQENSDAIFNSALVHELAVLRPLADPLLLQVRPETPEFIEANRLLSFLQWFRPAPADPVPDNSILREFIGGSVLDNFHLWPDELSRR
jgi:uridine kinase